MILRSGRMIGSDQFIINFDYASKMWRLNKIYEGFMFRYKRTKNKIYILKL